VYVTVVPLLSWGFYAELLSLTYQLEILIFQAVQLREFGWKNSLQIKIAPDRKSVTVQYWVLVAFQLFISPSANLLWLRSPL
jgi:mediator of RNA polymerase II transcription subunit 14